MGRQSKEEHLLRQAKHRLDVNSNDQSDFLGNSNDKDVHHKRTRKMGTRKYLRESCYHCIECSVTNSLATLISKRPLNSTFSAL